MNTEIHTRHQHGGTCQTGGTGGSPVALSICHFYGFGEALLCLLVSSLYILVLQGSQRVVKPISEKNPMQKSHPPVMLCFDLLPF